MDQTEISQPDEVKFPPYNFLQLRMYKPHHNSIKKLSHKNCSHRNPANLISSLFHVLISLFNHPGK